MDSVLKVYQEFLKLNETQRELVFHYLVKNQRISGQRLLAWAMAYFEEGKKESDNYLSYLHNAAQNLLWSVQDKNDTSFFQKVVTEICYLVTKKLHGQDKDWQEHLSQREKQDFAKVNEKDLTPMASMMVKNSVNIEDLLDK